MDRNAPQQMPQRGETIFKRKESESVASSAGALPPTMSDLTTWSEMTETTEATSTLAKWVELREKCEPLLIIARNTTPFRTGTHSHGYGNGGREVVI